jgi:hypothetical protein
MEWISISKNLPNEGERVLLYTPFAYFGADHSCIGDRESIAICTVGRGGSRRTIFTHWLPLPPAPDSPKE